MLLQIYKCVCMCTVCVCMNTPTYYIYNLYMHNAVNETLMNTQSEGEGRGIRAMKFYYEIMVKQAIL